MSRLFFRLTSVHPPRQRGALIQKRAFRLVGEVSITTMLASNILRNLGRTTTRITRRIHDDRPIDRGGHPHPLKFVPVDITNTKKFSIIFTLYVSSALMLPVGILFYQLKK